MSSVVAKLGGTVRNVMVLAGSDSVRPLISQHNVITRPGADGIELQKTGKRPQPFRVLTLRDESSSANAKTRIDEFAALKEGVIVYVDEWGDSHDVYALDVRSQIRPLAGATGFIQPPGDSWGLFTEWIFVLA